MRSFAFLVFVCVGLLLSCASTGRSANKDRRIEEIPDPAGCVSDIRPIRITGPIPAMSKEAKKALDRADVLVEVIVRQDGTLQFVRVLEAPEPDYGLKDSAVRAVSQWIYRPALRSGQPVECRLTIRLPFPPPKD